MPFYNLLEYHNDYSKTSRRLWKYYRDEPALDSNSNIADFDNDDTTDPFKFIGKIKAATNAAGTKDKEIAVPLQCFSNFWRTLEMALNNCKIHLILT